MSRRAWKMTASRDEKASPDIDRLFWEPGSDSLRQIDLHAALGTDRTVHGCVSDRRNREIPLEPHIPFV
jgi:hypothetical protein